MPGTFIVFEGGEGSGKTTAAEFARDRLLEEGYDVLLTHEPGGSVIGKKIRQIIVAHDAEEHLGARAELLLFLADRAHHVDAVIKPALAAGTIVLCDRFSGSTFAYQLGARHLEQPEFVKQMDEYARQGTSPDLVLYLDVDPLIGIERKRQKVGEEFNRLDSETLEFHSAVRAYFQKLSETEQHWKLISTNCPQDEGQQTILLNIREFLKSRTE